MSNFFEERIYQPHGEGNLDYLNRSEKLEVLCKRLLSNECPKVIGIEAEFGMGKTYFAKMVQEKMEQNGNVVGFINSTTMEIYDNPVLPMIQEIQKTLLKSAKGDQPQLEKIKEFGKNLFKAVIGTGAVIGKLPFEIAGIKITEVFDGISEVIKQNFLEQKNDLEEVKKLLENFIKEVTQLTNKPVLIIIDDIERCSPEFSVKILESIKHVFDIQGLRIIILYDKNQLKEIIKKQFGENAKFEKYLSKYVNFTHYLNSEPIEKQTFNSEINQQYINGLYKDSFGSNHNIKFMSADQIVDLQPIYAVEIISAFTTLFNFNLRDILRLFHYLSLYAHGGFYFRNYNFFEYLLVASLYIHNPAQLVKHLFYFQKLELVSLNLSESLHPDSALFFATELTQNTLSQKSFFENAYKEMHSATSDHNKIRIKNIFKILYVNELVNAWEMNSDNPYYLIERLRNCYQVISNHI